MKQRKVNLDVRIDYYDNGCAVRVKHKSKVLGARVFVGKNLHDKTKKYIDTLHRKRFKELNVELDKKISLYKMNDGRCQ